MQVGNVSASVFNTGQDEHSLPVIMKRLQNITIKRSRGTFNKLSIINKTKALVASKKKLRTATSTGVTNSDILPTADGKASNLLITNMFGTAAYASCHTLYCKPLSLCALNLYMRVACVVVSKPDETSCTCAV